MKKILTLACFICLTLQAFAQTDGITYQAVIISPDALELPGVDSEGNFLPNTTIAIRFTIFDSGNQLEFQEVQITETDEVGRINLLIGDGDHDYFIEMNWDGTPKDLKVEIDFDAGNNFETMSRERLTFLPYAFHRNITATGTLTVDDKTFLNGELQVEGPTNLNSTLDVNNGNATNLSGTLTVEGETNLNNAFNVNNASPSILSGDLAVQGNTSLNQNLDVLTGITTLDELVVNGQASFGDLTAETLVVNQSTLLKGQTIIDGMGDQIRLTSNLPLTGFFKSNHPVLIDGGRNGLAIEVEGSRNNDSNFITFYDSTRNTPWGRIEGETEAEFTNNADYNFDQSSLEFDIYDSKIDLNFAIAYWVIAGAQLIKASTDFRGCLGLGGCLASPGPVDIAFAGVELISAAAQTIFADMVKQRSLNNKDIYDSNKLMLQGVTYASGSGDYAEYLERLDVNEKMSYGDIVGLVGGKISKKTANAERAMVVSFKPIVLGNMPQKNHEHLYEKVAFMGKVPVKVFGKVNIGDYIIPSGMNDGTGIAMAPSEITIRNIKNIVGIAWSESNSTYGRSMVNVAIGLNKNDNNPIIENLQDRVNTQAKEISALKIQIAEIFSALEKIKDGHIDVPNTQNGTSDHQDELVVDNYYDRKYDVVSAEHGDFVYWEIKREDIETALDLAREEMRLGGVDVENNYVWKKLDENPQFKEELITDLLGKLDKQLHYHKTTTKQQKH